MGDHAILTLLGIANIAIVISGFSGLVAVFGDRTDGRWSPEVRFRTANMLILSLGACVLSLVPIMEELLGVPDRILWTTSSLLLSAFCAFYFIYTSIRLHRPDLRRSQVLIKWVRFVYFVCLELAIVLQALNVAGVLVARGSGPLIGGLIFMLIPAGLQFAFLVLTPLARP